MNRMCDKCIKRKTMYCPNSSECYNSQDVPYFQSNIMALEEIDRLNNIIDELEKWVIDFTKPKDSGFGDTTQGYMIFPHAILDKLKELKENVCQK